MATVWNAKPGYTEAQIRAAFGPGARIVQRGDGKWTVAGGTTGTFASQPPKITDTPGVIRPGAAPGTPGGAAIPPPPPSPSGDNLPKSYEREAGLQGFIDQINAQPGIWNPQRLALWTEGARGLTDQGLYDTAQVIQANTDPATGAVTYTISGSPDGRAFREANLGIGQQYGARGTYYSSFREKDQAAKKRDLTNARDSILRGLSGQQDRLTAEQTQRTAELRSGLSSAGIEYADWRAGQAVPEPAYTAPPPPPPAPTGGGGQARWKIKPTGFATVKRGGWFYRA